MVEEARKWFRPMARVGYAARGLIYLVIGIFAALAAIGAGEAMGSEDALQVLLSSGAGGVVAYLLVAGLLFYALWRLIQSGFDTDSHGTDAKGLAVRAGLLVSGVTYAALALYAWSSVRGDGGGGGSDGGGGVAEYLAGFVGARWVSGGLALILAGVGIAHIAKAVRERYAKYIEAGPDAMRYIHPVAKTGLVARGIVFLILSFMLATRAMRGGGGTPGSKEALEFIQSLPFGWLLLAGMGVGLLAFALYSFTEAAFRRINVEDAN
ncbi:hypothetical protein FHS85_000750 [Rhodoligotrophos appendicifer]|uniref:DUF1206 domain-containing protein n=1 Tax=Rhodoligotrophos appendicifer TaxID=987056 RepID=UPI0014781797|nr:DUF1206 domain-containing protein [Rhodoligotrophos appendicifer]